MKVNFLISLKDPVGLTIKKLGYKFEEIEEDVIDFKYDKGDAIVIFSRHESSTNTPSFTVHYPGNPGPNVLGGEPYRLGVAFPRLLTSIYREISLLQTNIKKAIEATHHGPTYQVHPVVFVEIGSDKRYWENEGLVRAMVEATLRAVDNLGNTECEEVVAGLGGTHYTPYFSKVSITKCISHVISKYYLDSITPDVVFQLISNTIQPIDKVIFDNVNSTTRNRIIETIQRINSKIKLEFR
ncbi:D-aminoacyl-tRNA deacylase [Stygiolobus caldivivus]|nr:D-aminoacyl-tRNA deacylase [Stygiolobus caldivivus]